MGLAVHPDFPDQPSIHAMFTYEEKGRLYNEVVRFRDQGEKGVLDGTIVDRIPGNRFHDGGRLAFG